MNINELQFGIEIELVKQTRDKVAKAIQSVVGGTKNYEGGGYGTWAVNDRRGRKWKVMSDASLPGPSEYQAEVVSPILTYSDIPELQEVVRAVRKAGAKTTKKGGIHTEPVSPASTSTPPPSASKRCAIGAQDARK